MARATGRLSGFECLTCAATFDAMYWYGEGDRVAEWNRAEMAKLQDSGVGHKPDCTQPHIRRIPPSWAGMTVAQVRESQRAVIYQYADGTWAQPGTNDPNDSVALQCARDGAVRREFYSVRDMREFQREKRKGAKDEGSGYNDVLDFDEARRSQRDLSSYDIAKMREREGRMQEAFEHMRPNFGKYDRVKEEYARRGWDVPKNIPKSRRP